MEQKIYPYHQDEWYVYHSDLSWSKKKVCLWLYCSNTLNVDEILKIYLIEQKIYPYHQDEW
jgi:hypothetical protein